MTTNDLWNIEETVLSSLHLWLTTAVRYTGTFYTDRRFARHKRLRDSVLVLMILERGEEATQWPIRLASGHWFGSHSINGYMIESDSATENFGTTTETAQTKDLGCSGMSGEEMSSSEASNTIHLQAIVTSISRSFSSNVVTIQRNRGRKEKALGIERFL